MSTTSTSSRDSSRVTGRDRVGCPATTTRSTCASEVAVRAAAGSSGARWRRCARRWWARRAAASRPPRRAPGPPGRRRRRRPRRCAGRGRARSCARADGASGRAHRRPDAGAHRSGGHQRLVELDVEVQRPVADDAAAGTAVRPTSMSTGTSQPKMPTWSVVWLALVPRSRAGRSAVTRPSGRRRATASRAPGAGWRRRCPDVHITAARAADLGQPERQEPGAALVDPGVQPDQPGLGGVVRREGQRCVARARAPRRPR